jgi:hypothetical protein
VYVVDPSVFVIDRSALGLDVSVSVAVLFPGLISVTPAGAVTVAVLTRSPVAPALTVAVTVNVAVPPDGRVTVALMLPFPLAGPVAPPAYAPVHVGDVSDAENASATVAPTTLDGPTLVATIV